MSLSIGTITIANEEIRSVCSICARCVRIISTVIALTEIKSEGCTFSKCDCHRKIVNKTYHMMNHKELMEPIDLMNLYQNR
jgi:hypothetical protein